MSATRKKYLSLHYADIVRVISCWACCHHMLENTAVECHSYIRKYPYVFKSYKRKVFLIKLRLLCIDKVGEAILCIA